MSTQAQALTAAIAALQTTANQLQTDVASLISGGENLSSQLTALQGVQSTLNATDSSVQAQINPPASTTPPAATEPPA